MPTEVYLTCKNHIIPPFRAAQLCEHTIEIGPFGKRELDLREPILQGGLAP
jgi:hypothetical protein